MSRQHPTRTRVAAGIYQDQYGYLATVTLGGRRRDHRFPLTQSIAFMTSWRIQQRAELDDDRAATPADAPPPAARGTWDADVQIYLPQIKGRASYKSDRSHLAAWSPHIGPLNRSTIKPSHIRTAMGAWLEAGKSARTVRHRIRVVRELYQALDGAHARPPIAGVTLPPITDATPTPVSSALIQRVATSLQAGKRHAKGYGGDSDKCYARFLIRALTGQRPCQVARAQPEDVDLVRRVWFVRAAKGGRSVTVHLDDGMVLAWQIFAKADAWGAFDTRSFSKTIRRHGWPANVRPYNLRHTFAIDHLLGGTDIGDLQGLLGHRQLETTRKFYAPIQQARLVKATANRTLKLV